MLDERPQSRRQTGPAFIEFDTYRLVEVGVERQQLALKRRLHRAWGPHEGCSRFFVYHRVVHRIQCRAPHRRVVGSGHKKGV